MSARAGRDLRIRRDAAGGLDLNPALARMLLMDRHLRPVRIVSLKPPGTVVPRMVESQLDGGATGFELQRIPSCSWIATVEFAHPIARGIEGSRRMSVSVRNVEDARDQLFSDVAAADRARLLAAMLRKPGRR